MLLRITISAKDDFVVVSGTDLIYTCPFLIGLSVYVRLNWRLMLHAQCPGDQFFVAIDLSL